MSQSKSKLAPCLWFDGKAEEAANFYANLFPDSSVDHVNRAPSEYPGGKAGDTITVEFTLLGNAFLGLNGGPDHKFNEAISLQVYTETQEETDRYWNALIADGGAENVCSWCSDKYGLHWQIVPRVLMEGLRHPDKDTRSRVFDAMGSMTKIDVAAIEAAISGTS